ncbi:hypothetical protein B7P43_G02293 [Cryptotermes secundus]|uniref:Reverse transcriptase domain-containing protein n=1 Tax=Cryptotermes secundus TaxID=105785 RepID=A0A2J7R579_9NEOP|nr:hypothetical protein B7P43_G02293 [Cryptotermes secundus]
MVAHLSATIEEDQYYCKVQSNDTIKIQVTTPESYRKLIKQLQDDKIIYHTYQLKHERAYRIVIRNLHHSIPTTQITAELEKQGHKVRNILNVKHRATKEPLPLFFIDLEPKENNKSVYDMEFLCNMKITVEAPRQKKHIVQCTRCQSYGHTKTYCAKPYACVKCGANHNTTTCTKPSDTPAKCALCGGNHPANYKGCEVYKNLQKTRGKAFNQIPHRPIQQKININDNNQFPPINPNQTPTPMSFIPQTSYSQVLTQNQQSPIMADQLSMFLTYSTRSSTKLPPLHNSLRIVLWNANGLISHKLELQTFLNIHKIDIALISETHFTTRTVFKVPNYKVYHIPHPGDRARGGAAVIIRNSISHHELTHHQNVKFQAANVKVNVKPWPLIVSAVYCPPKHAISSEEYVEFLETYGSKYIIGGDWNAKHTQWGARLTTTKGRNLLEAMNRRNCNHLSTGEPTYWPNDYNKLPDLLDFFIHKGITRNYIQIESNHELSSDHTPVIATLSTHVINQSPVNTLVTNATNWNNFRTYIEDHIIMNIRIKETDDWAKSDLEKAENFAEYLSLVFTPHDSINHHNDKEIEKSLDTPCQMSLPIKAFSPTEVKQQIKKVNQCKAPGYDIITGKILRQLPNKAIVLLTTIFNSMLRLSYFPTIWKFAQIVMIPKPGKPINEVTSYRPISLLPIPSKIFEKLLLNRIRCDTEIHEIIPDYQFGFREHHSTIHQTHRIINKIATSIEEKQYCTAAFLDVAQAFDKVWHTGLLHKIKNKLPSPYYLLLKSYLAERYFQVKYNNAYSSYKLAKSGVPQGSVLGPFLYLIYTADLPTTNNTTIATFADDTALLATDRDPAMASQFLQHHLDLLQEWFKKWKIRINQTKSSQITFTTKRTHCPPVTIDNLQIPVQTEVKYLGLHLDQKLTWQKHIKTKRQHLNLKVQQMSWLLGRKSKLSLENKILIYKCILKPIWTYGVQLWGCAKPSNTKIIQRLQSNVLRSITNAPWYVSNFTLHNDLQIPFVTEEIRRYSTIYHNRLKGHENSCVTELSNPLNIRRRLKRQWPSDLKEHTS